jgi:phage tail-like protein
MTDHVMQVQAYDFLIQPIRDEDQRRGNQFVERLLTGRQTLWESTQLKIFALKALMDIERCPDEYLQYLKYTVGWTNEPLVDAVTKNLDATTLRRLIAASAPFWKARGSEDSLVDILRLTTGQRTRIWNYFDFRWLVEESGLGEEHEGRDPWIIDLPGAPNYDAQRFNVRIADPDGSLDRDLVQSLVRLSRPVGERVEISYVLGLDLFTEAGDTTQWDPFLSATAAPIVSSSTLQFQSSALAEGAVFLAEGADDWDACSVYGRMHVLAGTPERYGVGAFLDAASDNGYVGVVWSSAVQQRAGIYRVDAGVLTALAEYNFTAGNPFGLLADGEWYGIRLEAKDEGGTVRLRLHLDGDQLLETTDTTYLKGSAGLVSLTGGTAECSEFEVIPLPMDTETIDINP